jgi:flagellar basal-body rod modification protein FlgD
MQVNGISGLNSFQSSNKLTTQEGSSELGEDAFLKLLLAQLQNQDPLKPMEDKEFIAQLAQFNSLNQLTQMNKTLEELVTTQALGQGGALIGKTVSGQSDNGETITGLVSGLRLAGGKVILDVEGKSMPIETLHSVTAVVN